MLREIEIATDQLVRDMRRDGDPMVDLWLRYVEHTLKVALIRTVADDPKRPTTRHDIEWASLLVRWCIDRTIGLAEDRVADSQQEAMVKRVLRLIRESGDRGLTSNQLTRKTQWLRSGDRKDILQTLIHSGQVRQDESGAEGPGRKAVMFRAS